MDRVVVSIHISGNCFEQDFHVLEGHHALILGMDFLTKQNEILKQVKSRYQETERSS